MTELKKIWLENGDFPGGDTIVTVILYITKTF